MTTWSQHSSGVAVHSDAHFHVVPTEAALKMVRIVAQAVRSQFPSGFRHRVTAYRHGASAVCLDFQALRNSADAGHVSVTFVPASTEDVRSIDDVAFEQSSVQVPVADVVDGIMLANLIVSEIYTPLHPAENGDCGSAIAQTWAQPT